MSPHGRANERVCWGEQSGQNETRRGDDYGWHRPGAVVRDRAAGRGRVDARWRPPRPSRCRRPRRLPKEGVPPAAVAQSGGGGLSPATSSRCFQPRQAARAPRPRPATTSRVQRHPARAGRQGQRLSLQRAAAGRQFRPGRPRRQPGQGRRSTSRSPARSASNTTRRARSRSLPTGRRSWCATASSPRRTSIRCRRRRCASCSSERIDLLRETNVISRPRRRRVRDRRHRGEARGRRHQQADGDGRRQGLSAEAVDGDGSAGLRHHGRGLQPRHQQAPDPGLFKIDYTRYQ